MSRDTSQILSIVEEKTVGVSFRGTPRMTRMFEAVAEHQRRSLTNALEVLVEDYCFKNGITVPREEALKSAASEKAKKL